MANGGLIACDGLYLNSLLLYIAIEQTIRSPFKCQFSIFIIQDTIGYRCSSDNYICLMLNRLIRRLIPKDFIYHDNNSINTIIIQNKNNNNSKNIHIPNSHPIPSTNTLHPIPSTNTLHPIPSLIHYIQFHPLIHYITFHPRLHTID